MRNNLRQKAWDKVYLWIYAIVEGSAVDKFVRRTLHLLVPDGNLEKQVKLFYGEALVAYGKLFLTLFFLGGVVREEKFWLLLGMCLPLGLLCPFWDLKRKLEFRKRSLQREYGQMLLKLLLYVGAGMSVRNAFERVAQDMDDEEDEGYLLREMQICVKRLNTGRIEAECYYQFGQRCDLPEYMRMGGLLAQNTKKGNRELVSLLEAEMLEAKERQRHQIRRNGELTSTKLLGPMMLLLAMVLLMIMIPALGNL